MFQSLGEGKVPFDDAGPDEGDLLSSQRRQRRGDADADFHRAALGGHREALHEHSVGAGGGDQDGVAALGDGHLLIGGTDLTAASKSGFAFFAIDPEG